MSSLRTQTLRLAASLPSGGKERLKLLAAVVKSAKKENKAQEAIWAAWDAMSGVERVREFDSFDGAVESLALGINIDTDDAKAHRTADNIEKKLRTLDRQSRSWRAGYNWWLEGRDIDIPRLLKDLDKTEKNIKAIWKMVQSLKSVADPDNFKRAAKAADKVIDGLDRAISILESGNY